MPPLCIVTGGAGFIGSHLVAQLLNEGQEVRVVERPGASVDHLPDGIEVVWADIRDRANLTRVFKGGVWVYHLAANPNLWARDRREFDAVNHVGAVNVMEAALASGARRVLHTSTESILTRAHAEGPIDEQVEIKEGDLVGPYCRSKWKAEEAAMAMARDGLPVVIANPTMPVGPGDRGLSPPTRLIRDFCRGGLPALLDCTLNLIDVRDAAAGLRRVMDRGHPGRRYLLGGTNLTLVELIERLSKLTGTPPPRWRVPYPLALAVAGLSEAWADLVSGQSPQATITGVRLARRTMHFDPSRSLGELELMPRAIDTSLSDAVEWLRQTGRIPSTPMSRE